MEEEKKDEMIKEEESQEPEEKEEVDESSREKKETEPSAEMGDTAPKGRTNTFRQKRTYFRKKVCKLCLKKAQSVDYKDVELLRRFITERGKILPRRITGTCARHQRMLSRAIKRARMIALLPFVSK